MDSVIVLASRLFSIFLIIGVGYFIYSKKMIDEKQRAGLSLILNRVALPMMIIVSILRMQFNYDILRNVLVITGGFILTYLLVYLFTSIYAKKKGLTHYSRTVLINGGVHGNVAFLGFPLIYSVFGEQGLFYATLYFVIDNVFMHTIGMSRLQRDYEKERTLAPVTIALIVGLILMVISHLLHISFIENPVFNAVNDLASITTPIAFMFIGMIMKDYKIKELLKNQNALYLLLVKMVVVPILLMVLLKPLVGFVPVFIINVLVIQASMPPYASLLSMAYEYKKDMDLASSAVVLGTLISIVTIPILFTMMNLFYT